MFHTHTKNDLVWLTSDVLENDAVTHGFSTRKGGVSPAPWDSLNLDDRRGDDIANVQENFRRLCAALDTDVQRAVLSRQVHRSDVRRVTVEDCGKGLWRPQDYDSADGLVTDDISALFPEARAIYEDYRLMCYNYIFDQRHHPEGFYSPPA